jgi:hypothetical protein
MLEKSRPPPAHAQISGVAPLAIGWSIDAPPSSRAVTVASSPAAAATQSADLRGDLLAPEAASGFAWAASSARTNCKPGESPPPPFLPSFCAA